jgi:hypothetical protein
VKSDEVRYARGSKFPQPPVGQIVYDIRWEGDLNPFRIAKVSLVMLMIVSVAPTLVMGAPQLKYDSYTSLEALKGQTARECLIASHDCEVCSLDDSQKLVCSSVGTGCEPKEWRCVYLSGE